MLRLGRHHLASGADGIPGLEYPVKRNPKQADSNLFDCIPQAGKCPMNCDQCFFNRPEAFYTETPAIPEPEEVGDGIVRMNAGHDSNIDRELVIATAAKFKHAFYNTSLPNFDFPGPVVWTANREEEKPVLIPEVFWTGIPKNLMFVRLRVSGTNLKHIDRVVWWFTSGGVPVVLTFMAYYSREPEVPADILAAVGGPCYQWHVRHINSYWCPTNLFIRSVLDHYERNRLVSYCGSLEGPYCRLCRNCEIYYIQTMKRMRGE